MHQLRVSWLGIKGVSGHSNLYLLYEEGGLHQVSAEMLPDPQRPSLKTVEAYSMVSFSATG